MANLRLHLTYANVIATVALFIALIGFKPAGATKTVTQTLTIKFKGARPRASRAAAVHSRFRSG